MTAVFVQRVTIAMSGVASNTGALTVSGGNFLFVAIADDSGTTTTNVGITDSKGNTYTQVQYSHPGPSLTTLLAKNIAAGATTFTVTDNQANGTNAAAIVEEWSLVDVTSPLDVTAVGTYTSTTTPVSGTTATTGQADELVLCAAAIMGGTTSVTAGAGYSNVGTLVGASTNGAFVATESKTVAATGTQAGGFTLGAARLSQVQIATFKAAAAAGGPTTKPIVGGMTQAVHRSSFW